MRALYIVTIDIPYEGTMDWYYDSEEEARWIVEDMATPFSFPIITVIDLDQSPSVLVEKMRSIALDAQHARNEGRS